MPFITVIWTFLWFFSGLVQARGVRQNLKYFFSTNNLRLVKTISGSSRIICGMKHLSFSKNRIFHTKWGIIGTVVVYFQLFSTCSIFGSGKKYSAGSQIFFLDKQSETCQKQPGTFATSFSVIHIHFMPNVEYFDSFVTYMRSSNCHEKFQACNTEETFELLQTLLACFACSRDRVYMRNSRHLRRPWTMTEKTLGSDIAIKMAMYYVFVQFIFILLCCVSWQYHLMVYHVSFSHADITKMMPLRRIWDLYSDHASHNWSPCEQQLRPFCQ